MKKKTVTSETEEITIDNKKKKRKKEKKAYREIRWDRLDNTAHLFPVIAGENMSNVYRISVTLTEPARVLLNISVREIEADNTAHLFL